MQQNKKNLFDLAFLLPQHRKKERENI